MRSTDKQDRNDWTIAIAEIIRKLEMIPQGDKVHFYNGLALLYVS